MNRRRIFISSVQKEFQEERYAIRDYVRDDALLGQFFEVFLFEDLPAADRDPQNVYLHQVGVCDVYLGLFGEEYGWQNDDNKSPTELEFDEATRHAKIRLIYVKGANDDSKAPEMKQLIRQAGSGLIRRRFRDIGTLLPAIYSSLVDYLTEHRLIAVRPWDSSPCVDAQLSDLDRESIRRFVSDADAARGFPLKPNVATKRFLTHLDLLVDDQPTNAAMMLFAKKPQRWHPTSEVKCAHFHGEVVAKPIPSYQTYRGNVFQLVDQAVDFVMSKLALGVGTRAESPKAPVKYEIPRQVIAEAIVNAVSHRDYTSNGSVQVQLFTNRLEVWNPGRLPLSLTPQLLRQPHGSVPHNPLIAQPLYLTEYIERLGTGTGEMIRLCRENRLQEPDFEVTDGFRATVWRGETSGKASGKASGKTSGKTSGKKLQKTAAAIVQSMSTNPSITIPELSELIGVTERAVEMQIRKLREEEIIGRVGPAKGGHWEILN